jgi:hypothetical protein
MSPNADRCAGDEIGANGDCFELKRRETMAAEKEMKTTNKQSDKGSWAIGGMTLVGKRMPITHNLMLVYVASLVITLIMAGVSVIGLLYQRVIYPTKAAWLAFVPSDGFMLVVQSQTATAPLDWIGVAVIPGMAVLCLALFGFFVRGAVLGRSADASRLER